MAQDAGYEQEPIRYSASSPGDAVAELQKRLNNGLGLPLDPSLGRLPALLKELTIPTSSQTLVFSKTSLQRDKISPRTPRAIYFNDDVYIGYCHDGQVIEIAATDPKLGMNFYTLDQRGQAGRPRITRQTDNCLQCHDSSMTRNVPGLMIRSVYSDERGLPILRAGTHLTTHESPLKERWGGWYVTGQHGQQTHMGNMLWEEGDDDEPQPAIQDPCLNIADVSDRFDASAYPSPHSDIVALMVLEHQVQMHNLITRANFQTRLALRDEKAMNEALGRPAGERLDSTFSRIKSAADPLIKYMLFDKESPLTAPIAGSTTFAKDFAARGPFDSQGRSLRQFDLENRLFRYPCSYLIYSDAYQELPREAKDYIDRRLYEILTGKDASPDFAHLSKPDRESILHILRETRKDLPDYWRE
jgi:hypothetical protein